MSKADGKKIALKFTQPLVGDVSGLTPTPVGGVYERVATNDLPVVVTASNTTFGSILQLTDGNTSTSWGAANLPCWIKIDFIENVYPIKLRLYSGPNYRVRNVTFQKSDDGTIWEDIGSIECSNAIGWKDYVVTEPFSCRYIRYYITTDWSTYPWIYEIQVIDQVGTGNEQAFSAIGQEPQYVDFPSEEIGPLLIKTFGVEKVEAHPVESDTILLTMKDGEEFKNVSGELTVVYDATIGNLAGSGGSVASFSKSFYPADLVRLPNPLTSELISGEIADLAINLIQITKEDGYDNEILSSSITDLSIVLTYTGGIDP